jgi:hypothetical protein
MFPTKPIITYIGDLKASETYLSEPIWDQ